MAQAVEIREVSWFNFCQDTEYLAEEFSGFPQTLQANVKIEFQIGEDHILQYILQLSITKNSVIRF